MKKNLFRTVALGFTALVAVNTAKAQTVTTTYSFTGIVQTYTVPCGVTTITVDARGAEGGDAIGNGVGWSNGPINLSGGDGGRVTAVITVTPGEVLNIYVGAKPTSSVGGFNGGGNTGGSCGGTEVIWAAGGGASDIRRLGTGLVNRIVVAGGGGGAAGASGGSYNTTSNSNPGGGLTAATPINNGGSSCLQAFGGTQVAGGAGTNNSCWCGGSAVATAGTFGFGGNSTCAPSGLSTCACNGTGCTSGGGGGGYYYGGGAGICWSGGAGGSSYTLPGATSVVHTQGFQTGNGLITIVSNVPVTPTVTIAGPSTVCAGSSLNLTANGASTYTWSTGSVSSSIAPTPTANATYSVVGTSSLGCTGNAVTTITVNALPTVAVNSGAVCAGQSFTMVASGANTYTYSSGSAVVTPTATSNYSVTGTSALGCVSANTAISSVTVNAAPVISVNSGAICSGQSFTMVPSGANTYTYSNGSAVATPTANASYTVTGTNTLGCTGNAAISTVTVNAVPTVTASSSTSGSICAGQSVSLTATGATTYSWNTGATTAVIAVSPSVTTTYTVNGSSNGCSNVSTVTQNVNSCVGIQTIANQSSAVSVYPNPSTGIFTVEFANGLNKTINVTDITGRIVLTTSSTSDKVNVNISTLSNGIYYIKVISNNNTEVIKVVKQ